MFLIYGLIFLCALASIPLAVWAAASSFHGLPRGTRSAAAAGWALLFAAALFLTAGTALRGGYDNEHDFGYLSVDYLSLLSPDGSGLFGHKEISPLALLAVLERPGGYSLDGTIRAQKLLWLGCALLVFSTLLRAGFGPWSAASAALLLFLNFLAVLNTYAYSTTNANLFFLLSGVCALAGFLHDDGPRTGLLNLAWFFSASFLVLAGRYEFFPALLWGFGVGLFFGGSRRLSSIWRAGTPWRIGLLLLSALFLSAVAAWGFLLPRMTRYNGPPFGHMFHIGFLLNNLNYQLGRQNLSLILGWPAAGHAWVVGGIFAVVAGAAWRRRSPRLGFWTLFLAGWALSFCMIYMEIFGGPGKAYALQFMRHHIYFFTPFVFLAGLLVSLPPSPSWKGRRGTFQKALVIVLAAGYGALNLRQVSAFQGAWRTNDREWRFLGEMSADWPEGCWAETTDRERQGLLRKYFPTPRRGGDEGPCRLLYRSPIWQVFTPAGGGDAGMGARPDPAEAVYGKPVREIVFPHRYYTGWPPPAVGRRAETRGPVQVRIGFYEPP